MSKGPVLTASLTLAAVWRLVVLLCEGLTWPLQPGRLRAAGFLSWCWILLQLMFWDNQLQRAWPCGKAISVTSPVMY